MYRSCSPGCAVYCASNTTRGAIVVAAPVVLPDVPELIGELKKNSPTLSNDDQAKTCGRSPRQSRATKETCRPSRANRPTTSTGYVGEAAFGGTTRCAPAAAHMGAF
jgi:hypothetical protein